jgi:hypothetical protein
LHEELYAVRAKEVIGRRAHVLTATELRQSVGLRPAQKLVLLLFDSDPILERIWEDARHLLPEIAGAGYEAVVAPSYSIWLPRPRTEFLYNVKRSLVVFQALQQMNVPAIPRVAWVVEHDVRRFAKWASDPALTLVALDLMTFRTDADWRRQIEGLELFDRLTGRRLRYLVNGPTTIDRFADLYCCVPARRVSITNATLAAPAPGTDDGSDAEQLLIPTPDSYAAGREMRGRCRRQREMLFQARQIARGRRAAARRPVATSYEGQRRRTSQADLPIGDRNVR